MTFSIFIRKRFSLSVCALVTTFLPVVAWGDESQTDAPTPITWRGCEITKNAFMGACAEAYEIEIGQKIIVSGGGAALGIRAAAGGRADLGGTCRHHLPNRFDSECGMNTAVVASQGTVTLEMGLTLTTNYKHWDDTSDITNFKQLLSQAKASAGL